MPKLSHPVTCPELKVGVVTNANARKNRRSSSDRVAVLQAAIGEWGVVRGTQSVEALDAVIEEFFELDLKIWVADGGDGAFHWMVNRGLMYAERLKRPLPMILPSNGGTINVIGLYLNLKGDPEQVLSRLRARLESGREITSTPLKSMCFDAITAQGEEVSCLGFAAALTGAVQSFYERYYESEDPNHLRAITIILRVMISIILSPLRRGAGFHAYFFKTSLVRLEIDYKERPELAEINLLNLGAIPTNLGAIMRVFYLAKDHPIHLMVGQIYPWRFLGQLMSAALGRPLANATLYEEGIKAMSVEALDPAAPMHPIIDGERLHDWTQVRVSPGPIIELPKI